MQFVPPRCPNLECPYHSAPVPRFFLRHGSYKPKCRQWPVPRFRCRNCRRGFSFQTFRADRGDRRPDANPELFRLLVSGVGLRQSRRLLALRVYSVQRKLYKLGRQCAELHRSMCRNLLQGSTFQLDEEETYETASIRTVTMPVVIECTTWFVVSFSVAPIRRLAAPGTRRRAWQDRDEETHGRRRDASKAAVYSALRHLRHLVPHGPVLFQTDEKATYRSLIAKLFGPRAAHERTPGSAPRNTRNPLFPINTTLTMARDNCGRLRRQSWLVTKRRRALVAQMHMFVAYRNYVRRRFNSDPEQDTAAKLLGLAPRAMQPQEILSWRQDWGMRSIHPLSRDAGTSVGETLPATR